jgi:hypothetical protein
MLQQKQLTQCRMAAGFAGLPAGLCSKTHNKTCQSARFCVFLALQQLCGQAIACAGMVGNSGISRKHNCT